MRAVGAVLAALLVLAGCDGPERDEPRFGVLGSSCAADRVAPLADAGVAFATVDVRWDRLEPAPGAVDAGYADELRGSVARCRDAGLDVVLGLGLQYAPDWVREVRDGTYRDQHGAASELPNVVFSAAVREAVADYVDELGAIVDLDDVAAVRVGTGEAGELGYPGRIYGTPSRNAFWAFDDAAQGGPGLADGVPASPLPGWRPGTADWRGEPVTADDVRAWFAWYADAAARAAVWQVGLLRDRGFTGEVFLPLAGRGVLPADLDAAVRAELDGTGDRDGSFERGLYYPDQLPRIAAAVRENGDGPVVADVTGVDDATAVAARELDPPQDSCLPGDAGPGLTADPGVARWSAFRWTVANARVAGLDVAGENPGSPDAPGTGGDDGSDDLAAQLTHAPRYARECGMTALSWAFEDDLFAPDGEPGLDDYAAAIHS